MVQNQKIGRDLTKLLSRFPKHVFQSTSSHPGRPRHDMGAKRAVFINVDYYQPLDLISQEHLAKART